MADDIAVFEGGHADEAAFVAGKISRQDGDAVLGAFVVEPSFYHGVGVGLQGAINRHALERKMLLRKQGARKQKAGDKKGGEEVFLMGERGLD